MLALLLPPVLAGCAGPGAQTSGPGADAPLSAINDPNAHSDRRIRAIRHSSEAVARGEAPAGAVRENLKRVAWSRSTWWQIRVAAVEELLKSEPDAGDTRNMLRLMLPTEDSPELVKLITSKAADGGWKELAPSIVRRWSRLDSRVADKDRPERAALAAIFPGKPVEDTVFDVFAARTEGPAPDDRTRQDAWALLCRIDTAGRARELLSAGGDAPSDPLLQTLRKAASDLGCVPTTSEQLAWVQRLGEPDRAAFWSDCAANVARLSREQAAGLGIRHLSVIRWCAKNRPDWLSLERPELLAEITRRFEGRKHHWRSASSAGRKNGESLHQWGGSLCWGDCLTLLVADEAMKSRALAARLFEQAAQDKRDTSTELGGNVVASGGGTGPEFAAELFEPRATQRYNDRQFVPSDDMIKAGDTALFHYHFHATQWANSDYAGPSQGDMDSAAALGRACLVFTAVSEGVLNVDYYQANGAVIDLGEIRK